MQKKKEKARKSIEKCPHINFFVLLIIYFAQNKKQTYFRYDYFV